MFNVTVELMPPQTNDPTSLFSMAAQPTVIGSIQIIPNGSNGGDDSNFFVHFETLTAKGESLEEKDFEIKGFDMNRSIWTLVDEIIMRMGYSAK